MTNDNKRFVGDISKEDVNYAIERAKTIKSEVRRIYFDFDKSHNNIELVVRKRMPEGSIVSVVVHSIPLGNREIIEKTQHENEYSNKMHGFMFCMNVRMFDPRYDITFSDSRVFEPGTVSIGCII